MELRHLRYFVAVAENLNFTKAATRLHLAQPSLTRQIHNLEDEIGVRLLNRSKSQVALTEEGRAFLVDARRVLALATESVQAVQFRALEARKIDLGFVGLRPPASTKGLQWESIARHKTVVVLPEKHPLARKRRINLGELKTMFFVGMSEKTHPGFRDWLCETCQPAGFTPKILQDAELEPALMTFVAEGLGVTLAREHIKTLPHPGVAIRPLAPPVKTDYYIAWNRDNDSRALQQYVEIVKSLTVA